MDGCIYVVEQSRCCLRVGCLHLRGEKTVVILWSNLVVASEWVVSIFGARTVVCYGCEYYNGGMYD